MVYKKPQLTVHHENKPATVYTYLVICIVTHCQTLSRYINFYRKIHHHKTLEYIYHL